MLIYGRQRRHRFYYRHLISPTRHGCTTHSEMRYLQVELVTKSILSIHSVSVMTQIFFIDCQQYWKYDRTMNTGANAHGKRAVSTLEIATSDRLDLRWQLVFQWHGIGIEIVLQVPRLFHNATVSQCDHFLLLHMYMYLLFETSPGWRGFFKLNFVGATELQCIYYLCRILISRPPRVFRRFKRRSCLYQFNLRLQHFSQFLFSVRKWFSNFSKVGRCVIGLWSSYSHVGIMNLRRPRVARCSVDLVLNWNVWIWLSSN